MVQTDQAYCSAMMSATKLVHPVNGWLRRPSPVTESYCSHEYPVRSYSLNVLLMMLVRSSS